MLVVLNIAIAIQIVKTISVGFLMSVGKDSLQKSGNLAWNVMRIWFGLELFMAVMLISMIVFTVN